jgi:molybdopterin-biosynthesis enzyme MoeA-like protein
VTHRAVAQCFGVRLVRSPELESLIRGALGDRCTDGHLLMADVPEGAQLISSKEVRWPTVLIENVFVLPGLPKVFRLKLPGLRELLRGNESPFITRAVYTMCDEGELAQPMARVAELHADVSIGSYPVTDRLDYRVKLTIDGTDLASIERAEVALRGLIPREKLVEPVDT